MSYNEQMCILIVANTSPAVVFVFLSTEGRIVTHCEGRIVTQSHCSNSGVVVSRV